MSEADGRGALIGAEKEFGLGELVIVALKYKWVLVGLPVIIAIVAAIYTSVLPPIFTASTKILPPQPAQSTASSLLAQLGGTTGLLGAVPGLKGPNDLYIAMLKSRTVADALVRRFDLAKKWMIDANHPSDVYGVLSGVTSIASGKDGLISIEVDDKNPQFAADLANAYVDELFKFTGIIALTEASQRRLFFERQFGLAKDNLLRAESAARKALQAGGVVKVEEQGRTMVEAIARLRGQITVKEVQIGAMRMFAADKNPDLQRAQQELESTKLELARLEGATGTKPNSDGRGGPGIDNVSLLRDVKYYEVIFELLARQYEMAKIDEAKDSALIQIIDKAIAPDRKSKPKRTLLVLLSAVVGAFLAILWVIFSELFISLRTQKMSNERRETLHSRQ